ncbi:MAG: ABC transporter substrate-binding protein [Mesorhizobium sp.]|nr:ABC transporter substrate-binding protein [Mesorhizobium sp.]
MRRWTVIRHRVTGYRLVGLDIGGDIPRISSPVVEIDPAKGTARTQSGRLYRLEEHLDAPGARQRLLLRYWQAQFGVPDEDIDLGVVPEDVALDLSNPANMRPA